MFTIFHSWAKVEMDSAMHEDHAIFIYHILFYI